MTTVDTAVLPHQEWPFDGRQLCAGVDTELFFPLPGAHTQVDVARSWCNRCPIRVECLRWAITTGQQHGIWGGTTIDQRNRIIGCLRTRQRLGTCAHGRHCAGLAQLDPTAPSTQE